MLISQWGSMGVVKNPEIPEIWPYFAHQRHSDQFMVEMNVVQDEPLNMTSDPRYQNNRNKNFFRAKISRSGSYLSLIDYEWSDPFTYMKFDIQDYN